MVEADGQKNTSSIHDDSLNTCQQFRARTEINVSQDN